MVKTWGKALYMSNLRVQQLRLLSASAVSIRADTSFAGYLRMKKHNQWIGRHMQFDPSSPLKNAFFESLE